MTRTEAWILIGVSVLLVLGAGAWRLGSESAKQAHCNDSLGGLAVKEGSSGRVVCIRKDAVLKVYQ